MKKFFALGVLLFLLVGCSSGEIASNAGVITEIASAELMNTESLSTESLSTELDSELDIEPSQKYAASTPDPNIPTVDDVKKYDEILKYLNSDYSRPESELLEEIAPQYGTTVNKLKEWIDWVMPYATGLETPAGTSNEPDFVSLIAYAKNAVERITGKEVSISFSKTDWDVSKTYYRYVMKSDMKIGNESDQSVIIKLDFFDATYKEYGVLQLKINNVNIDL
jgi:hypothetical protein